MLSGLASGFEPGRPGSEDLPQVLRHPGVDRLQVDVLWAFNDNRLRAPFGFDGREAHTSSRSRSLYRLCVQSATRGVVATPLERGIRVFYIFMKSLPLPGSYFPR